MTWQPDTGACRPEALRDFHRGLGQLQETQGLVRAAVALGRHTDPLADGDQVLAELQSIATRIQARAGSGMTQALVAHAHEVLFAEMGLRGNRARYYDAANSNLAWVLRHRRGIPITLTLIYKAVLEELGLPVQGIGAPGHFLASVAIEGRPALVDPFHGGVVITRAEAFERVEQVLGRDVPRQDSLLPAVDHAAWLRRMLRNLQEAHRRAGQNRDRHAMLELELLLDAHLRQA